jgi:ADP-ribose pyrophosphatase
MMIRPWPVVESNKGPDMGLFSIRIVRSRSPRTGHEHDFYVIDFPNWVQVLPITPEDQVVMVRQYRHGCGEVLLELPGGLIDNEDGNPEESAKRELLEETGYAAEEFVLITKTYPQPAVLSNMGLTYLARNARKIAEPQPDAAEDIEVCLVKLEKIPKMIRNGELKHSQSIMGLSLYLLLVK